jgi:ribonuclease BN (tRNA processing enzyme)
MKITFLGTGDAFGSGGRFNTCFHVASTSHTFLVDCGSSSMIAMRKFGIEPNEIDFVLITHCHGDHFGGLPYLILDAQLISRRTRPLIVAGPPGLPERLQQMMEACFPGSSQVARKFDLQIVELAPSGLTRVLQARVGSVPVKHPSGATPSLALRVELDDKVLAYTGDTEWVDGLIEIAESADLLIAEGYMLDRKIRFHLDVETLASKRSALGAARIVLTHMSQEMLRQQDRAGFETAFDGLCLDI